MPAYQEEGTMFQSALVGREGEFSLLESRLEDAFESRGSTVLVSGEAGIGKTRLVSELIKGAEKRNAVILKGWCLAESFEPLMPVREALRAAGMQNLVSGSPPPRVISVYLMTDAGLLAASVERDDMNIDPDIFASMLTAVGSFVQDSLGLMARSTDGCLNSLGYGGYRIVLQSSENIFLAVVIEGNESEFLIEDMCRILSEMKGVLEDWHGDMAVVGAAYQSLRWFMDSGKYDGAFIVEDPKLRRENLFDNVLMGLKRVSEEKPVLLFLDDVQWADPTTLNLMHYLARNTRNSRFLIVGTYRPEDVLRHQDGQPHHLETTMQNMSREELFCVIELHRLGVWDMAEMLDSTLGGASFDNSFLERLHRETGGNPFFILEVVKYLAENQIISKDENDKWFLGGDINNLDIPSRIYDVVKRRLDRVTNVQRELLECASVVGEEFSIDILEKIMEMKRITLLKNLGEIEKNHQLIQLLSKKYRFVHAKVREVLYNDIPGGLRQEYHRMIADILADLRHGEPEFAPILAYHYRQAEDARAVEYFVIAGDNAREKYSNEEAILFYTKALEFNEDVYTLENLADVKVTIGDYKSSIENYQMAEELAENIETKARCLRKIGGVHNKMGEYAASLETLAKAKKMVEEGAMEYGYILSSEGTAYLWKGDYDTSLSFFSQAKEISEKLGNMSIKGNVLRSMANIFYMKGDCDEAIKYCNMSMEAMDSIGNKWGVAAVLNNVGLMNKDKGDVDSALEHHERSLEILTNIGDKGGILLSLNNIGLVYHYRGDMDKALELYCRSLEIAESIGDKSSTALVLDSIGETHMERGSLEQGLEAYNKSLEIAESIGGKIQAVICHCGIANIQIDLGNIQDAIEHAERALETVTVVGAKTEEIRAHIVLGRAYRELDDLDRAAEELQEAMRISEETDMKKEHACALYEYGFLSRSMGRTEESKTHFQDALEEFQKMGMKLWAEKCIKALDECDS